MVACRSPKSRGACSSQAIPVLLSSNSLSLIFSQILIWMPSLHLAKCKIIQVMGLEPIQHNVMVA